jgi:hypothetical protein
MRVPVGPLAAFPGNIDPFGMAEFVAHKIEIAMACRCQSCQPDHLVQRNATGNHHILQGHRHVTVDAISLMKELMRSSVEMVHPSVILVE